MATPVNVVAKQLYDKRPSWREKALKVVGQYGRWVAGLMYFPVPSGTAYLMKLIAAGCHAASGRRMLAASAQSPTTTTASHAEARRVIDVCAV